MSQNKEHNLKNLNQIQKPSYSANLHWYHWLIVSLSLFLTIGAWYISKEQIKQKVEERFHRESDRVVELVKERMELYENALWGGVALFDASEEVTYHEWIDYATSLKIDKAYPGINGIGVIYNIQINEFKNYLTKQQKLRPDFKIHPVHNQNEYWPITFIEPYEINKQAVGLDMAFETNRYEAIKKSRDTGGAQVTAPIILVQDAKKTPGFLFYAPFYKDSKKPLTIEERRENIVGVTYAPFIMHKLMEGTLAQQKRHVSLKIRDQGHLLFDDHSTEHSDELHQDSNPLFKKEVSVSMYGRTWTFDISSNLSFRHAASNNQPLLILLGGITIDLLLLALFITLARSNKKAITYSRTINKELQLIFDNIPIRIWYKDDKNKILRLNKAAANSMNMSVEDVEGADTYELYPEMAKKYHDDDLEVIHSGQPKLGIVEKFTPIDAPHGWVKTDKVPYTDPNTGIQNVLVIAQDITDIKNNEQRLNETIEELSQYTEMMAGREKRMIELKRQINELSTQLGKSEPYDLNFLNESNNPKENT